MHRSVINGSFYNKGSTISENIRYFIDKYDINVYDWGKPLNIVKNKVYIMIAYIQMLIFNVLQMPLSTYVKIEKIKDMMYLQALILMIFKNTPYQLIAITAC